MSSHIRKQKKVSCAAQGFTAALRNELQKKYAIALQLVKQQVVSIQAELDTMQPFFPEREENAAQLNERRTLHLQLNRLKHERIPKLEEVLANLVSEDWDGECRTEECGNFVTQRLLAGIETEYCAVCAGIRESLINRGIGLDTHVAQEAIAAGIAA